MITLKSTALFDKWLKKLKDPKAKVRILTRLARLEIGQFGDVKYFETIGELRIDYAGGYRVYFQKQGREIVLLLCGGDKSTQKRDIKRALEMVKEMKNEH